MNTLDQPIPPAFALHYFEKRWIISAPVEDAWGWLCNPRTFTEGQLPPYRVEFLPPLPELPADFSEGVFTIHHGPLINFAGVITKIDKNQYRELRYFYGSYALSLRLIRPTKLEFWVEPVGEDTQIRMRIECLVRRPIALLWSALEWLFFLPFPWMMGRAISRAKA